MGCNSPTRELLECLGLAAQIAGSDMPADVSGHLGPPVVPGDKLQCLEEASMTGDSCVVVLFHDSAAEVLVPRDNNLAMEVEQTGVDTPLGRLG